MKPDWEHCCYNYTQDMGFDKREGIIVELDCRLPTTHYVIAKPEYGGQTTACCEGHARQATTFCWVERVIPHTMPWAEVE